MKRTLLLSCLAGFALGGALYGQPSSASATTLGTLNYPSTYATWPDTGVTPSAANLWGTLRTFNSRWGEMSGNPVGSPYAYNMRFALACSGGWHLSPMLQGLTGFKQLQMTCPNGTDIVRNTQGIIDDQ